MRKVLTILLFVLFLVGCSPKIVPTRDSISVETRTEYREVIDTVFIKLPVEKETVMVRDTVSHLENKFAVSDAEYSAGFLYHSLFIKDIAVETPVINTEYYRDSVVYVDKVVTVFKKEPLSKFVKFQIIGFWTLLMMFTACIIIKLKFKFF